MASPRATVPPLELLFAYGPAVMILAAGIGGFALPDAYQPAIVSAGWIFATAILLFLAGVTRGLSFFTAGGPRPPQIVQMLWLFLLGAGSMLTPLRIAFILLTLGFASIALFDPPAARSGLAPAHFARLRPPQMILFVAGLILMLVRVLRG